MTPPLRRRKNTYMGILEILEDLDYDLLILQQHRQRPDPEEVRYKVLQVQNQLKNDAITQRLMQLEEDVVKLREENKTHKLNKNLRDAVFRRIAYLKQCLGEEVKTELQALKDVLGPCPTLHEPELKDSCGHCKAIGDK